MEAHSYRYRWARIHGLDKLSDLHTLLDAYTIYSSRCREHWNRYCIDCGRVVRGVHDLEQETRVCKPFREARQCNYGYRVLEGS